MSSIERKFTRYRDAFDALGEDHYSQMFGQNFQGFRVLCIVPNERRRDGFLRTAAQTDLQPLIWVTTKDVIGSRGNLDLACWHTSLDEPPHALAE